ncbi:MAG: FG-GAP repeat domain-containing protein [Dehalococcoidia bacterium]
MHLRPKQRFLAAILGLFAMMSAAGILPVASAPPALLAAVLFGDATGSRAGAAGLPAPLTPARGSPFAAGRGPQAIAVGDFNGDGRLDLAVANRTGANVSVLLNSAP